MKRILIITSNSLRHMYFANQLAKEFDLLAIISESKKNYFHTQRDASNLVKRHFISLEEYERKYLGKFSVFPPCELKYINSSEEDINNISTINWAVDKKVDIIFVFGSSILNQNWIDAFPKKIINLHLGYAPRYRGSATLFWPFYNDELHYLGATIHLLEHKVDSGDIIKIIIPEIQDSDNFYDINLKTIRKSIDEFSGVVKDYLDGKIVAISQNPAEQKYMYRKSDFNELVLMKVLEKYGF